MHSTWYLIVRQEGNKKSELILVLAHIWIYFKVFRKDQFQGRFYSIYFSVIFVCWGSWYYELHTDDNTPHVCSENVDVTLEKLDEIWRILFEWFSNNFRTIFNKSNTDKYHLNLSMDETFSINIDNEAIKNSIYKKMLGVILNNRLGFDTHVTNICNRVSKDLHT